MFNPIALQKIIADGGIAHRQNAISYIFTCPICSKTDKLYVRKRDGASKCWVCGDALRGYAEKALVALYGGEYAEYRKILRGEDNTPIGGLRLEFEDHWGDEDLYIDDSEAPVVGWEWPPTAVDSTEEAFEPGRQYLLGRGLNDAVIKKYGIRYMPGEKRVCFPYRVRGEVVGWQGRYILKTEYIDRISGRKRSIPKALTTLQPDIQNRYVMFAENLAHSAHAVISEGPITALKAELCGGNVCTLGKNVSDAQVKLIADRVGTVYLAADQDAGTDINALATRFIARGTEVRLMKIPEVVMKAWEGKDKQPDFGDCTFEQVREAFDAARIWLPGQFAMSLGGKLYF